MIASIIEFFMRDPLVVVAGAGAVGLALHEWRKAIKRDGDKKIFKE